MPSTTATHTRPAGLDERALDIQKRARTFVDEVLIPLEVEAESLNGLLPEETIAHVRREATAAGLTGGLHAPEHGGQGWTAIEWFLVEEQLGRSTNAISWFAGWHRMDTIPLRSVSSLRRDASSTLAFLICSSPTSSSRPTTGCTWQSGAAVKD